MVGRATHYNNQKRHAQREFGYTERPAELAVPQVGNTYSQKSGQELFFTVFSVHLDPNEPGSQHRKRPYMRVVWSDRPDQLETYSLESFTRDLAERFVRLVTP